MHPPSQVADDGRYCRMSVDGTDLEIQEPSDFNSKWWSHKLNTAGLRYEIGVCIQSSLINWAFGPFPCGRYPDDIIFRLELKHKLGDNEVVIADKGYTDEKRVLSGLTNDGDGSLAKLIRARHQIGNKRIKQFNVMSHRYRHNRDHHYLYFFAVVHLTQLSFQCNEPLFNISTDS